MANQQGNADLVIQLPWTVPQQPLIKTEIIAETNQQKIPLDLNVTSTDTTAISSFALSVIIALILGSLATWLAYWYGRKSFKLTEMSFKVVSEDIKEAAQTHRETTVSMFEQQKDLKKIDYKLMRSLDFEKQFHEKIALYLSSFSSFRQRLIMQVYACSREDWENFRKELSIADHHINKDIHGCYENLIRLTIEMSFLVTMEETRVKELFSLINEFNKEVLILSTRFLQGKNSVFDKIQELTDQKEEIHLKALRSMQYSNIFKE